MTQDAFVNQILETAKHNFSAYWQCLPDEQRFRLAGLEDAGRAIGAQFMQGLFQLYTETLEKEADHEARRCTCGRCRERQKTKKRIRIDLLGVVVTVLCIYYYCRRCKQGSCPMRRWLGVEDGAVSLRLERATTDLSSRLTFGDTVATLAEQHGQAMDRTKAERITYRVGEDAITYLAMRRARSFAMLSAEAQPKGVETLQFTADGGGIPVGQLKRPQASEITEETPLTPVRRLPQGKRDIQKREARFIAVRRPESKTERVVDCHIAPYNQTEVTGERMLAAAAEAGLRQDTHIHGVFDMGKWIHTQFEAQFGHYTTSAVADIMHVTEYLTAAGRVIVGEDGAYAFGQRCKQRLLVGEVEAVLAELNAHTCTSTCKTDEHGCCLVSAARRYMNNHRCYLNYPPILAQNLPVGSGEAESGIRHIIKKRGDVAGAWVEANANKILALITIRESGWWDDFWRWRDERDLHTWHKRQRGHIRPRFRGKRTIPVQPAALSN